MPPPRPLPLLGPREAGLLDALAHAPSVHDALNALDEYAWGALAGGTRVRDLCAAANRAVHSAPPSCVRLALNNVATGLLFPFALPANAPTADAAAYSLPPSTLAHLSRRQLVDALSRIAREREDGTTEARVLELVLEYVGRRWRSGDADVIESIARKLVEVEAEVQVHCDTRSVLPTLQAFRFRLGLVSEQHLVARLNVGPAAFGRPFVATDLISVWATRRLCAGMNPGDLATELHLMCEHLVLEPHRDAVDKVLASLALNSRSLYTLYESAPRPRTRTLSRLSFHSSKRKTLSTPPWSLHRDLSVSKLQPHSNTNLDNNQRRPSLPTHLAPAESPRQRLGSPLAAGARTPSSDSSASPCTTPTATGASTPRLGTLGALGMSLTSLSTTTFSHLGMKTNTMSTNALGLADAGDVRSAVVDHLLGLRYRLGADADGWWLGGGKDKAADFLHSLESKGEMKEMVADLRRVFGIAGPVPPPKTPSKATSPIAITSSRQAGPSHQRDQSFDLDQYLDDIGPQGDENSPSRARQARGQYRASVASMSTIASSSASSTASSPRRQSVVVDFTIEKATRLPVPLTAVQYRFPQGQDDDASVYSHDSTLEDLPTFSRISSKSMPNVRDTYTQFPSPSPRRLRRLTQEESVTTATPVRGSNNNNRQPGTEFPSHITPPLSPAESDYDSFTGGESMSSPTISDQSHQITLTSSPGSGSEELGRSRRAMFRNCVIVDGAQLSPCGDRFPDQTDGTPLTAVLSLFTSDELPKHPEDVEQLLTMAVDLEAQRSISRGEAFDAEARARVAWLLEQVARELDEPELIAAVGRVLQRLSGDSLLTPKTPEVVRNGVPNRSPRGRRDLTITVPPRRPPPGLALSTPSSPAPSTGHTLAFPQSRFSLDSLSSTSSFGTFGFDKRRLVPRAQSEEDHENDVPTPTPSPPPKDAPWSRAAEACTQSLSRRDAIVRRSPQPQAPATPESPAMPLYHTPQVQFPIPSPAPGPSARDSTVRGTAPLNINPALLRGPTAPLNITPRTTPRTTPRSTPHTTPRTVIRDFPSINAL